MKVINDFDKIQAAQDFKNLPTGGYVCKILNVIDTPDREFLKIEFDIAEGEYKNYYHERYLANDRKFWSGATYKSYSENGLPFFKAFIEAVEESNCGYYWNWVESTLRDKLIGFVLAEEEYRNQNGEIKKRMYVAKILPIAKIREGAFVVPELKTLKNDNENPVPTVINLKPTTEDNLPF